MTSQTATDAAARATNGSGQGLEDRARSYGGLMALYAGLTTAFLAWRHRSGQGLPERYEALDLATVGLATHKTSRLISKQKVTAPLRAPFTEPEEMQGFGEIAEKPVGSGLRRTVGELLACPYCLDMWLATAYTAGLVAAPRTTRFVAGTMSTVALADFLQVLYRAKQESV